VLLVPDADRPHLLRQLTARTAVVVGPARPWMRASASYARAMRARQVSPDIRDTEDHLVELVLSADAERRDLRARALAPLRALPVSTARRLEETLRAWLLHHGRREEVATALFVHPQTVRYRMSQLRELYPDLASPQRVLELTLAIGLSR
ncbi:PucR family transcriptional regulator, partial [Lentzea sp. PSKA42]